VNIPDQQAYNSLPPTRGGPVDPLMRYKSDYQCKTVDVSYFDFGSGTDFQKQQSFALDIVSDAQPLNGILSGINTMLREFELRGVTGDRVGVMGFDDGLLDQRRLPKPVRDSSGQLDNEPLIIPDSSDAEFSEFLDATDVSIPVDDPVRYTKFLFPRYYSDRLNVNGNRRPAMTDTRLVLDEALQMLSNTDGFEVADNFVLLISDGLGNCVEPSRVTVAPIPGVDCFHSSDPAFWSYTQGYILEAFDAIVGTNGLLSRYQDSRIKLHVALIGDGVAPHKLLRKGSDGNCMTETETLDNNLSQVNAPMKANHDPSSGEPYYFPNRWGNVAAASGGRWAPVVECCRNLTDGACWEDPTPNDGNPGPVENILNSACQAAPAANSLVSCPCDRTDPACLASNPMCNYVDQEARLLCDPRGRSKQQQLQDLVQELMNINPFILVE
jgi:hypothetical protein